MRYPGVSNLIACSAALFLPYMYTCVKLTALMPGNLNNLIILYVGLMSQHYTIFLSTIRVIVSLNYCYRYCCVSMEIICSAIFYLAGIFVVTHLTLHISDVDITFRIGAIDFNLWPSYAHVLLDS